MNRYYTTPSGMKRAQERLTSAISEYERVVSGNAEAADAGDSSVWHDNFAYEENQRQMHQWARRIRDLRQIMTQLEVVTPARAPQRVQIGCRVVVCDPDTEREEAYVIAGYEDGDPAAGRLSYTSPMAQALLGGTEGESRVVLLGDRRRELEIVDISGGEE